jgi:Calponin homology (CH) domain/CAMSAP CH domain
VLDLTSLFSSGDGANETTTTNPPPSKSPVPLNYNAPTPPPWKNRATAVQSPATLPEPNLEMNPSMNTETTLNKEDLQWDTKSQTTQEALLTERQCQALTQWLNFVLVGEQPQEEYVAGKKVTTPKRLGTSFEDDDKSRATTPTHLRSLVTTPSQARSTTPTSRGARSMTPTHKSTPSGRATPSVVSGRATPSVVSGRATPSVVSGRATPSVYGRATPTPSHLSDATQTANNRRRHRRLSLFQYAESYEHAQDQAHHWFQHSAQWKELRRRIRMELASGKLALRDDRNLYANMSCRDTLLELFCSYKPAWLTLALEVVMDDTIPPLPGNTLPTMKQLKHFIIHRVLMDTKLLAKYTHGRGMGTPSGKFEKAFQAELQPLVLYRILVLVFFLDRAAVKFQAQSNTMGNLFLAKSKVKSTAQVLVTICREFLSRQGDIIKQMARANLHVYYKQDRLDEIEYPIVNFAIDLRDGVRLCRVVEVLWLLPRRRGGLLNNQNLGGGIDMAVKYPLLHQLRIPAISRLQKIHNVNVALGALQEQCQVGLPNDLQAHHIVDGQRRMVMRLVWTIVLVHCFEHTDLLSRKQVASEIAQVQAMLRHHKIMQKRRRQAQDQQSPLNILERENDAVDSVAMVSTDDKSPGKRMLSPMLSLSQSRSSSFDEDDDDKSDAALLEMPAVQGWKGLLFQWCQEVCVLVEAEEKSGHSVPGYVPPHKKMSPEKWTSNDLANGKALCCLIHYYHPAILPLEELRLASKMVDGPPLAGLLPTTSTKASQRDWRHSFHDAPSI